MKYLERSRNREAVQMQKKLRDRILRWAVANKRTSVYYSLMYGMSVRMVLRGRYFR
jgi:hypothetical protein